MTYILYQIWNWITGIVQDVIQAFLTVPAKLLDAAINLLPPGLVDYFTSTIDVPFIASAVLDVTWILPFWGVMAIYMNVYGLIAGVRLIRWILAFVPTIGG